MSSLIKNGAALNNQKLARILHDRTMGDIGLTVDTINFLEKKIKQEKPRLMVEYGSGISTVCFSFFMREIFGTDNNMHVVSIEQSENYAREINALLSSLNLHKNVLVLHSNLVEQEINGLATFCYDLKNSVIRSTLGSDSVDFVVIDGPSGGHMNRYGTLPLIKEHLHKGALIFLDDAFRDWELEVAQLWKDLDWISMRGIHNIGKGLLEIVFTG
jgi:predicted O-methyltransferase YrrM